MQNREKNTIANSTNSGVASAAPLYNSRIIDNYIKLIKRKYNHINVNELLDYAGMTLYEIADEGHWFTQEEVNRFHEKLSLLTNNENIAREAGRYAASPGAIGAMKLYLLGTVGPGMAYELISRGTRNLTRSSVYDTKKIASNKVQITVKFKEGVKEKPFQCENRQGFFEAMAMVFTNKLPRIEHSECIFKGGKNCSYLISWDTSITDRIKKLRNLIVAPLLLGLLVLSVHSPFIGITSGLPATLLIIFMLSYAAVQTEKKEVSSSLNNLLDSTDKLVKQIEVNYNNAILSHEIGQVVSKHTSTGDIFSSVVKSLRKWLDYDRCMILLADKDKKRLLFRAGYGYNEAQLKLLKKTAFHLNKPLRGVSLLYLLENKNPFW